MVTGRIARPTPHLPTRNRRRGPGRRAQCGKRRARTCVSVSRIDPVGRSRLVTLDKPSVTPANPVVHLGPTIIVADGSLVCRDRPSVSAVQSAITIDRRSLNLDAGLDNPDREVVFGAPPVVDRIAPLETAVLRRSPKIQTPSVDLQTRRFRLGTTSIDLPYGQPQIRRASSAVPESRAVSRADVIHIRSLSSDRTAPATDLQTRQV